MKLKTVGLGVALLLACGVERALAGDGVVALQTADPACPDDSGDIYVDCGNGTVTDNRTGLVWLANASCLAEQHLGDWVDWHTAMEFVAGLSDKPATSAAAAHDCGLSDGSSPGEWRLPSIHEWELMIDDAWGQGNDPNCSLTPPLITNDSGLDCWVSGPSSFLGVRAASHWSSTTFADRPTDAWKAQLSEIVASTFYTLDKQGRGFVWPVRGGQ